MSFELIDDRYLRLSDIAWRDLATGRVVVGARATLDGPARTGPPLAVRELVHRVDEGSGPGLRVLRLTDVLVDDAVIDALADGLRGLGYVLVQSGLQVPECARRHLVHRHVALLSIGPSTETCRRWIRELAAASPRGHVLVLAADWPVRVEESAPWPESSSDAGAPMVDARVLRAARFQRVGRHAAAARWLRAAVAGARRRGDDRAQADAVCRLAGFIQARGSVRVKSIEWLKEIATICDESLIAITDIDARARVVALSAEARIAQGDLEMATASLGAVEAECGAFARSVPWIVRERQVEIACWRGRWDEARARLAGAPAASVTLLGWAGLIAWARRDAGTLEEVARRLTGLDAMGDGGWPDAVGALWQGWRGDRAAVARPARHLLAAARPSRWGRAIAIESLRLAGDDDEAQRALVEVTAGDLVPIEAALVSWIGKQFSRMFREDVEREIARFGAAGIRRWGVGRSSMNTWCGVSSLLQIIQDADDEATALGRACGWARDHAGAEAVAVLTHDATAIVVADPPGAIQPRDAEVQGAVAEAEGRTTAGSTRFTTAQPVRYGGARIGWVVARMRGQAAGPLGESLVALAAACAPALRARLDAIVVTEAGQSLLGEILGCSPGIAAVREATARVAATSFPVLIEGESGTGKELVARALHRLSPRRDRRFAAINCAALTDDLLEAELFGHARGAFTGAVGCRQGLFEDAHEGTLFLDEVAELSPRAQAKLLRVLQEGEIRRVGENGARRVDVRVIAATNRSLADAARAGVFRDDLIFRLAVVRLRVPSLRDRLEDVPALAHAFWREALQRTDTRALVTADAIAALCRHGWPGNVRELHNVMAALAVAAPSRGRVTARHVAEVLGESAPGAPPEFGPSLDAARQRLDRRLVSDALARHGGRRTAAARELGVSRQGLAKLIGRLGIARTTS